MLLIQLSMGAIAPIESMLAFFRYLSWLNPLRHYVNILQAVLLRGVGLEVIWPYAIALLVFATVLGAISANQFRHQVS